jgi:hypothetical protein
MWQQVSNLPGRYGKLETYRHIVLRILLLQTEQL